MRRLAYILAIATLIAAWFLPWPKTFVTHMSVHMTLVAISSPLLAIAVAGTSFDPVKYTPQLFQPLPVSLLELAGVWLWHTPSLHSAAQHNTGAYLAEQATFLISGFALWIAVLGGDHAHRATRSATGIVALLLTAMHMTLLGALIALAPEPLYHHTQNVSDQHTGGVIMLLIGGVSYLAGGLALAARLLSQRV